MSTTYTKAAFFNLLAPIVLQARREGSPLFPSVRLAQSWLETGGVIPDWNNLGGYKVGGGAPTPYWNGSSVNAATREVVNGVTVNTSANFRAYTSIYNYFKDQDLLFETPRYAGVRAAATPVQQCQALYAAGYATDPSYATKLIGIIQSNGLTAYDYQTEEEIDMAKAEELEARIKAMEQKLNMSGKEPLPAWAEKAVAAGKTAGAITTSADKNVSELIALQMLYNLGLLDKDVVAAIQKLKEAK